MPINSRQKGARAERELAKKLTEAGFPARRGQQFSGIEGEDVICESLPIHFEVKHVEKLNVYKAMEQSKLDATDGMMPIVAHRRNGIGWHVTLELDWFLGLCRDALQYQEYLREEL